MRSMPEKIGYGHFDKGEDQNVQVFDAQVTGSAYSLGYSQSCYFAISITTVLFASIIFGNIFGGLVDGTSWTYWNTLSCKG